MHDSAVLRDNPLGDPHQRKLSVSAGRLRLPRSTNRRYPTLYDLPALPAAV